MRFSVTPSPAAPYTHILLFLLTIITISVSAAPCITCRPFYALRQIGEPKSSWMSWPSEGLRISSNANAHSDFGSLVLQKDTLGLAEPIRLSSQAPFTSHRSSSTALGDHCGKHSDSGLLPIYGGGWISQAEDIVSLAIHELRMHISRIIGAFERVPSREARESASLRGGPNMEQILNDILL